MAVSFFDDKTLIPTNEMIASALGGAHSLWEELKHHIGEEYPAITEEWKFYGKAAGWSCKIISKKRNLLFFIPLKDAFRLRIVLGEKAAAVAESVKIPNEIKQSLREATPYAEGRSIDIDVNRKEQLDVIKTLLKIKYEN
jgi:hypothetical protein